MATELKTRKYTKEQMVAYLEKHGSTLIEASGIAGTNPRTLGRYLSQGIIPSEWLSKIQSALKDRKPVKKTVKSETKTCTACGKKLTAAESDNKSTFQCVSDCLEALDVKDIPTSGWHWWKNPKTGERRKMYAICEKCWDKLETIRKSRKKTVKAKIASKKD